MKILSMLEEGKITAEDAAKLLQSIGNATSQDDARSRNSYAKQSEPNSNSGSSDPYTKNNYQRQSQDTANFDEYARDFGRKIEMLARDLEPKIQKLAEVVVEKTATYADKVSKTMTEASRNMSENAKTSSGSSNVNREGFERNFEMVVSTGFNELNFRGLNGGISVKGYNGDKITAKVFCKPKRAGASIELMQLGNKYYLNFDEDDFRSVSIDALIPESLFKNVTLQTSNAGVDATTIRAENVLLLSSNAPIQAKEIHADVLKIETSNAELDLCKITCPFAQMETSNAQIKAELLDISKMKLTTSNAKVSMTVASLDKFDEYTWDVETSNAKLNIYAPTSPEIGYHVKAQTSLGNVRFGITGLNYLVNEKNTVEARSIDYSTSAKKINLNLETSNGQITVE